MDQSIFAERRKEFMSLMGEGVAIFAAAPIRIRNHDVDYEFRQDSNFFYLTGFEEPECVCILAPGHSKYEYILFVRPKDKEKETWTGLRAGIEGACENFRADIAYPIEDLESILPQFLQDAPRMYYTLNLYPEWDQRVFRVLDYLRQMHRAGIYPPSQIIDPSEKISEMRLIKRAEDIEVLQKAVDISVRGHVAAMKSVAPEKYEYEVQAVLEYIFRSSGSMRNGYPCIVGSGPNTCILHYNNNDQQMKDGDLLLVDAGAELDYFTGDVTRTYPVNGKFTAEQRSVYEVVLQAQKKAIEACKPGNTHHFVHQIAVHALTDGMIQLGLLRGSVDENIENENYKKYYFHRTGHWLGMDVHDTGKYRMDRQWRVLEEGMVTTVEPGLYIPSGDEHSHFRNIGIRIEDDVLITSKGPTVLSAACPKEIKDLEAILGTNKAFLL
jgi:Xaa-Pro aminopeptidase